MAATKAPRKKTTKVRTKKTTKRPTASQRAKQRAKEVKSGELQEESLEDQLAADSLHDAIQDMEAAAAEMPDPVGDEGAPFRPSDLEAMIEDYCEKGVLNPATGKKITVHEVDRFRFIRDNGLPNPTRLYRVTGRRATKDGPIDYGPVEVEANDPSEALTRAADKLRISYKERHRVNFLSVVLEQ